MPAWPGGPCPDCGQDMPAKLVHCQYCRALLNPDLYRSDVEIPEFFELKEISDVAQVKVLGFHILCPHCQDELRISRNGERRTLTAHLDSRSEAFSQALTELEHALYDQLAA